MSDGPVGVIFSADEGSIVTGVDYSLRAFRLWNPKIDETDRPMDGVVEMDQLIEGRRADIDVFGERILTYTVPGQILLSGGAVVLNQPFALRAWVEEGGDVIIDRAGWGQIKGELEVYSTIQGNIGDYLDLEAPHQVNAKVAQSPVGQRGGTRVVQIIGRTEKAGTSVLQLLDAGNLAQDPPIAPDPGTGGNDPNDGIPIPDLSLAPSVDSPLTIATVTVDNATDITPLGGNVDLQYLVQVATPDPTDNGAPWGPVLTSQGIDELDLPEIETGETIWVRGQTFIPSTQQRSDWSTWISITLGPDDDGSGGVLPPIDLSLSITASGVVSALATGIAAIIKVYFDAGTPNGAAPTYAETLAGVTDTSVPFTAPSIILLTEGDTVTVGAIGEDALGNRTILVTESISFSVNTGSGVGSPGNLRITFHATPPLIVRNVYSDAAEPTSFFPIRKYENTSYIYSARLQLGNHHAASADTEIDLGYSLDGGATMAVAGPKVRLDRVNFPEPGAWEPLVAGAVGPNVLLGLMTAGGDGTDYIKVGNIYLDAVSGEPPMSPTGDPPGDLPTGGPFGNLVLDHNADTIAAALGLSDNDPLSGPWPDDSPSGNDAVIGPAAPVYKATGGGAGNPSVRFTAGSNASLSYDVPAPGSQTRYIVMVPTTGYGSGGRSFDNGTVFSGHGASNIKDIGLGLRADGKLALSIGENAVVTTFRSEVTASAYTGAIHLFCILYNEPGGYGQLFVDDMTTAVADVSPLDGGPLFGWPTEYMAYGGSAINNSIGADYCRNTCWDAAHGSTQRAAVKAVLQARWGTP